MNSNNNHPESDCGNYPTPAPVAELPKGVEGKAKELHHKFYRVDMMNEDLLHMDWEQAKQCALIACDEIINEQKKFFVLHYSNTIDFDITHAYSNQIKFWQQVRTAINQL